MKQKMTMGVAPCDHVSKARSTTCHPLVHIPKITGILPFTAHSLCYSHPKNQWNIILAMVYYNFCYRLLPVYHLKNVEVPPFTTMWGPKR